MAPLTDDQIASLPEEPNLAFVALQQYIRQQVAPVIEREGYNNIKGRAATMDYVTTILAAAEEYNITAISNKYALPPSNSDLASYYASLTADIDVQVNRVRFRRQQLERGIAVALDKPSKEKIHNFITKIREVILSADLPVDKKEALLAKLAALAAEVDRDRTRTQAVVAVWLEICDAVGQGFEKLKPVKEWIDAIGNIVHGAQKAEQARLPAPTPQLQLAAPSNNEGLSLNGPDEE